eukprot:4731534-Ditylum_brightwellii.AAC.1
MSRHYQVLLQQTVLAVRAAHAQRVQKEGINTYLDKQYPNTASPKTKGAAAGKNVTKTAAVSHSPGGRKSRGGSGLLFSAPSILAYANDFFGGETADDLAEIVDGAV